MNQSQSQDELARQVLQRSKTAEQQAVEINTDDLPAARPRTRIRALSITSADQANNNAQTTTTTNEPSKRTSRVFDQASNRFSSLNAAVQGPTVKTSHGSLSDFQTKQTMTAAEKDRDFTLHAKSYHYYSTQETSMCADWINVTIAPHNDPDLQHLFPDGNQLPTEPPACDEALFKACKDGWLLAKLINFTVPGSIDLSRLKRNAKGRAYQIENIQTMLLGAKAIGVKMSNIGAEDIIKGTPHLILSLTWQVIKVGLLSKVDLMNNPSLKQLFAADTSVDSSKLTNEALLLKWVNFHLNAAGSDRKVGNFSGDLKDGQVLADLLLTLAMGSGDKGLGDKVKNLYDRFESEEDLRKRTETVLYMTDVMGVHKFITADDIMTGNKEHSLAFIAQLLDKYPNLEESLQAHSKLQQKSIENLATVQTNLSEQVKQLQHQLNGEITAKNDLQSQLESELNAKYQIERVNVDLQQQFDSLMNKHNLWNEQAAETKQLIAQLQDQNKAQQFGSNSSQEILKAEVKELHDKLNLLVISQQKYKEENSQIKIQLSSAQSQLQSKVEELERVQTDADRFELELYTAKSEGQQTAQIMEKIRLDKQTETERASMLQADIQFQKAGNDQLQADINELKKQHQVDQASVRKLTSDNDNLLKQCQQLKSSQEKGSVDEHQLLLNIEQLTANYALSSAAVEKLTLENKQLQSNHAKLQNEYKSMTDKLSAETAKLQEQSVENDNLVSQKFSLSQQLEKVILEQDQSHNDMLAFRARLFDYLKKSVTHAPGTNSCADIEQSVTSLVGALQRKSLEVEHLKSNTAQYDVSLRNQHEQDVLTLKDQLDHANAKSKQLHDQFQQADSQLSVANRKLQTLSTQLNDVEQQLQQSDIESKKQIIGLKKDLTAKTLQMASMAMILKQSEVAVPQSDTGEQIEHALHMLVDHSTKLKSDLNATKMLKSKAEQELQRIKLEELEPLQQAVASLQQQLKSVNNNGQHKQQDSQQLADQCEQLQHQLHTTQTKLHRTQQQLDLMQQTHHDTTQQLMESQSELQRLQISQRQLQSRLQIIEQDNEGWKLACQSMRHDYQQDLSMALGRIKNPQVASNGTNVDGSTEEQKQLSQKQSLTAKTIAHQQNLRSLKEEMTAAMLVSQSKLNSRYN